MFCIFLNFVYTLRYFCTFKRQNRGWFQSRHIFVLLKTKSRLDFNLATCKLSIQFPPRKSPWSFLRREINGEKFGRQLFWMFAIKIAGRTPIWLIFSRGVPYFAIAEGFHYHLLGQEYIQNCQSSTNSICPCLNHFMMQPLKWVGNPRHPPSFVFLKVQTDAA